MQLSGICGRADVMQAPEPGGWGGTYAGNPLALASALAVLDIIDEEDLLQRGNVLGDKLQNTLKELQPSCPQIAEVRGLGAMVAVEFRDRNSGAALGAYAKQIQKAAQEKGPMLLTCDLE